jgi:tetratricopeptide (TPR) repeat protein
MDETDLFFNLRLGELILSTHRVPTVNLLSFTFPAARDVNLAWIFQVVLALVHRAAGIPGTVLLKTAFVLGTWTLLFRVAVRRGAEPGWAAGALALAAWSAEPRFVERPHLVTFVGLSWVLLALERAETGRSRGLWWLVPAGLVWANANSCFFLAPAVLFLYAAGGWHDGARPEARRAAAVGLALVPLMFATPSGFHSLSYIANHFRMPWLRPLQEYRTASWPVDGPFFFLIGGLLLAVLLSRLRGHRPARGRQLPPWRVLLPLVALGALGALRIRFVAEFSILAGPALAVAASQSLPLGGRGRGGRLGTWVTTGALSLLTVIPRIEAARGGRPLIDLGMEAGLVPEEAIAFVDRHGLRRRMYNDLEVGSYLTWHRWPDLSLPLPVFQDPRINGYPEAFHAVLRRADLTRAEWQRFLDGFSVEAALLTYPDVNPRAAWFDPEKWALVYQASDGLVFTRRLAGRAPLIEELEIPVTFTYAPATGLSAVPLGRRPAGSTVPECAWQRRLGDLHRAAGAGAGAGSDRDALAAYQAALASSAGSCLAPAWQAELRQSMGEVALRLGDPIEAAALLDGLVSPEARANHGFALLALHQPARGLLDFEAVLAARPDNAEARFGCGLALEELGRAPEAEAAFTELLERAPRHLSAPVAREHLRRLRRAPAPREPLQEP